MKKDLWAQRVRALQHGGRLLAMVAAMALTCPVHAQTAAPQKNESGITLYGGYRWGGSLTDETTGTTWDLTDDSSYALAVDIGVDRQTQVQLFYSQQQGALSSGTFAPTVNNIGLDIDYYHIGGTYFMHEVGAGYYVVGGFGATHARPDREDLNSETFLSANLGLGYMLPLGKHAGLRFEARGYGTLINNDSSLFCSDNAGCVVTIKGDGMYQGEVLAGLSIRF
ncbi:MAG: hypothetical protein ACT4PQ_03235 [Betaproteobacteria bacterium]